MADEWSKPVKGPYGWSVDRGETKLGLFWDGDLVIRDDDGCPSAPRDVVLRLLAAEASDRLGWVWEVRADILTGRLAASHDGWSPMWEVNFEGNGVMASLADPGLPDSPDELLAAMHGRFLLADALREANDGTV